MYEFTGEYGEWEELGDLCDGLTNLQDVAEEINRLPRVPSTQEVTVRFNFWDTKLIEDLVAEYKFLTIRQTS